MDVWGEGGGGGKNTYELVARCTWVLVVTTLNTVSHHKMVEVIAFTLECVTNI